MTDDLKNSAQVWGGQPQSHEPAEDSPPAYSGHHQEEPLLEQNTTPTTTVQRRITRPTYNPLHKLTTLASVPFHKYNVPDGVLSPNGISLTVKHSELYSQPHVLLAFILEQATLPPKPMLHITGSHCGTIIDFDINLNLTHLLNLQKRKWRFNSAHVSPIGHGASRPLYDAKDDRVMTMLSSNIKQFCKDRAENKSYTLTRTIEGLPTEMLAGQVRNLAASVKYRGLLKIEFVDERSKVVVHKQPSSWFSNLIGLHPEKRYEMAETVWDLSSSEDSEHGNTDESLRAGQEWWKSWTGAIRNAMIMKHKGNVGIEDWIEARMGHIEAEPRYEWGNERSHQS